MKKFTRICMWTALACFLAGILLVSISWAMGFRGWRTFRVHRELETRNEIIEGEIESLSFQIGAGSLYVEEGDDFAITASSAGCRVGSRVENGTWVIDTDDSGHAGKAAFGGVYVDNEGIYLGGTMGEVHVTIPKNVRLKRVEIDVDAGAAAISRLQCDDLDIDVDAGSVEFEYADVRKSITVDVDTGSVNGILSGCEDDFTVELDCDLGSIVAGSYELGGIVMGHDRYLGGDKKMLLSCDVGSIDLAFLENAGE